jgi:hypothetical protein
MLVVESTVVVMLPGASKAIAQLVVDLTWQTILETLLQLSTLRLAM